MIEQEMVGRTKVRWEEISCVKKERGKRNKIETLEVLSDLMKAWEWLVNV